MSEDTASLPYEEPGIVTILILSSFLLLLNAINHALDKLVYCGLIGQILIGIAWGQPGTQWLSREVQDAVMQLGYLGLILMVYEGGLSTNLKTLRANLALSATVALIGISTPIALSFILQSLLPVTPLQAFAAGAALCSTSLGTTFTVLSTSGLVESRLGVVLSSAAMMDDVVGLVMVQVISNLGPSNGGFDAVTVVRPVLVSIAFAVVVPLSCRYIIKPMANLLNAKSPSSKQTALSIWLRGRQAALVLHTAILLALVTGATYAGTSNLFAAYLAGAAVNWLSDLPSTTAQSGQQLTQSNSATDTSGEGTAAAQNIVPTTRPTQDSSTGTSAPADMHKANDTSGIAIYESCYAPAVELILKPFFFASIGFSIPVTRMFGGQVIWRGLVYAILMTLSKLVCGVPLIRFSGVTSPVQRAIDKVRPVKQSRKKENIAKGRKTKTPSSNNRSEGTEMVEMNAAPSAPVRNAANTSSKRKALPKPRSLYPALMLGSAMVARGEIGFLISSVAEGEGIFSGTSNEVVEASETFLVVTWAILICTILGPVSVGLMTRRVKALQQLEREKRTGKDDPLGIWGVIPSKT